MNSMEDCAKEYPIIPSIKTVIQIVFFIMFVLRLAETGIERKSLSMIVKDMLKRVDS